MPQHPFDAVLMIAFGGPQGPADIRPFLGNVLRGRRVTPERVEEVARHYELFGGVSPLTELTLLQADGLRARLKDFSVPLPVYVGMRNWHPYLKDTLAQMSRDGVRRAVGFIAAAQRSYSSCTQYREDLDDARQALHEAGVPDVEVVHVGDWHTHPGFIEANAAHVRDALRQLPANVREEARIIFTAHSIPSAMAERYPYERQLAETARKVAAAASRDWTLVYQSRSGRPEDPWLGPDVCDFLRSESGRGLAAVVLSPIGFICDHVEVLYDLDVEAAAACREVGLPMVRARAVNDHPAFLDMMADVVMQACGKYRGARPLTIALPKRS
ncbi:MAG: ferrochelatase [Acidobacteria bacterium]|nr:ferrochelatase [Acidobacteriota bacterium]